jgi:hypothetical protein
MGRPRTPTTILKALGAFKKDPQREREREGEPVGSGKLGRAPAAFMIMSPATGYQRAERLRKIWRQVQLEYTWLNATHRSLVTRYCMALDRANEEANRGTKAYFQAEALVSRYMSLLCVGPGERSRALTDEIPADGATRDGASVRMNLEIDL